MDKIEKLLKELTETDGATGYENEIRKVLEKRLKDLGQVSRDNMGSLICKVPSSSAGPKVMLASHMDEIGFMVKHISSEGYIKFTALGGWWDQVLLTQRVKIKTGKGDVTGVIGAKPPHLIPHEERTKTVVKNNMYIDVGATSDKEVERAGIRIGDPVTPYSEFTRLSIPKTYMAKAFDDRIGCAVLLSVLEKAKKQKNPNTIYGAATVQEEVGVRGATTSVELVDPDVAIILESDIAGDVPGIKPEESSTKLGKGPSILMYDSRMIPNLKLRDMVIDTAKKKNIPLQFNAMEGGATDGSIIHIHKYGVPTVVIGVPTRHIHSHNSIVKRVDLDNTTDLVLSVVNKLNSHAVSDLVKD